MRHQVGEAGALPVLRAIDAFAQAEERRWAQLRAGTLPPILLSPEEQLDELMQQGYQLLGAHQTAAACDVWLLTWALVKQLAGTHLHSVANFDRTYSGLQSVENWCFDMIYELGNAGVKNPAYFEHQLRFSREYLAQFPEQPPNRVVTMLRAQGDALWRLGQRSEAEATYAALVERLPDEGWAYIGWSEARSRQVSRRSRCCRRTSRAAMTPAGAGAGASISSATCAVMPGAREAYRGLHE